jgi:pSer/pThr/pTyr-binding forkhead associated (FHA) protein
MRDGLTIKREHLESQTFREFTEKWDASLVVVSGTAAGMEYSLERSRTILGRGPGVDIEFPDAEMSRQHVAVEYSADAFRASDLGSTNGTLVDGTLINTTELKHGDRIEIGKHVVQFLLERRPEEPKAWVVPSA